MTERPTDKKPDDDLLRQMLEDARLDAGWGASTEQTVSAAEALLTAAFPAEPETTPREALTSEIDALVSAQVEQVLAHPDVQKLRTAWRRLEALVDRIDFDENVRLEFLSCSKQELAEDFEAATSVTVSTLYERLCEQPQGVPYSPVSLIVADYEFGRHQQDIELLTNLAAVAADAHAPLVSNASSRFFGCEVFSELEQIADVQRMLEAPFYAAWQSFRRSEDARYVALCVPENAHDFAIQLAASFAEHRGFEGLVSETGDASGGNITEQQAHDLSEGGFLVSMGAEHPRFRGARSAHRPKRFSDTAEGRAAALESQASGELVNVLTVSRLAHYVEAIAAELRGADASALERALQQWLPKSAYIEVTEPGYLRYELTVRHPQVPGVALQVAGRLD